MVIFLSDFSIKKPLLLQRLFCYCRLFSRAEVFLAHSAKLADKVLREILKGNSAVLGGIIFPAAYIAYVFHQPKYLASRPAKALPWRASSLAIS